MSKPCEHFDCGWCYADGNDHDIIGSKCGGHSRCELYLSSLTIEERHEYWMEVISEEE